MNNNGHIESIDILLSSLSNYFHYGIKKFYCCLFVFLFEKNYKQNQLIMNYMIHFLILNLNSTFLKVYTVKFYHAKIY